MLRKSMLATVAVLSCCALMCVGFASWSISAPSVSSTVNNSIIADDVIVSDDYVSVAKDAYGNYNITPFRYNRTTFLNSDGSSSEDGIISVALTVNVGKCKELVNSTTASVTTIITFKYLDGGAITSTNLFKYIFANTGQVSANITDTSLTIGIESDITASEITYKLSYSLPSTLESSTLTFNFNLSFKVAADSFNQVVYVPFAEKGARLAVSLLTQVTAG